MSEILTEIAEAVLEGDCDGIAELCRTALGEDKIQAACILKQGLLAGMNEVGVLFRDGDMFLPEVLMSAQTMQNGVDFLTPYLKEGDVEIIGRIVTATVEGDLHDIGIKLVGLMLEGAGFEVIHIGVDKNASEIVDKVQELKPDILAMSAMLTTTMGKMGEVISLMKEAGLGRTKVMVGGAPLSAPFAEKIGARYSADAAGAVIAAKELMAEK